MLALAHQAMRSLKKLNDRDARLTDMGWRISSISKLFYLLPLLGIVLIANLVPERDSPGA